MKRYTFYGVCAILAGVLWAVFKYLVNHTPGPFSYDDYNRFLTIPLILMFICSIGIHKLLLKQLGGLAKLSGVFLVFSFSLLLLGNVVEFWVVLLQSKKNAYEAYQSRSTEVWVGSDLGWIIFIVGSGFYIITSFLLGLALLLKKRAKYWNLLILIFGLIGTLSFGPEIFLIPYAVGWLLIGGFLINFDRYATSIDQSL